MEDKDILHLIDDENPPKTLMEELRYYNQMYNESFTKISKLLGLWE